MVKRIKSRYTDGINETKPTSKFQTQSETIEIVRGMVPVGPIVRFRPIEQISGYGTADISA
jgi:hypothetical protein